MRADLSRGLLAAMIVHAAGESSTGNLPEGTFAVALAARDERDLEQIAARLRARGVAFVEIREPDPPHNGALMALGIRPGRKEDLRRALSSVPLLR